MSLYLFNNKRHLHFVSKLLGELDNVKEENQFATELHTVLVLLLVDK